MRLLFYGSGEFGLPTLKALHQEHELVAVISQPDRPAGRNRQLTPTPMAQYALDHGIPLLRTEKANAPEFVAEVQAFRAAAAVVIAFGQKLSPELIAASGRLVVNLHASLLPRYRGAAPINWAIIRGEVQTGVSVIALAQKMDAGLIYAQEVVEIGASETAGELHDRLALLGPGVIGRVLRDMDAGCLTGRAQDEAEATPAPKLSKADSWVDFTVDALQVVRRIHGLTPWPGVRVIWRQQETGREQELMLRRVQAEPAQSGAAALRPEDRPQPGRVGEGYRVAVRDGWVRLLEVQAPGGRPMLIEQFARGHALKPGDMLWGQSPVPPGRGTI